MSDLWKKLLFQGVSLLTQEDTPSKQAVPLHLLRLRQEFHTIIKTYSTPESTRKQTNFFKN